MISVDKISENLASRLGNRLNKSEEEIAVLNYGLFVILHTSLTIIVTIIIGIITNLFREILIILFCCSMLKRYSGGIHASSPMRCLIVGTTMSTLLAFTCKLFSDTLNWQMTLLVLIIGLAISYFILYKRCPVGSKQKPLKKESKRKLLRKKSFSLMNLYSISIILLYTNYVINGSYLAKSISISILFGLLIQIFSLSKSGEKIIGSIDRMMDR